MPGTSGKVMGSDGLTAEDRRTDGTEIIPIPGFVVKTYAMDASRRKVFINICHTTKLAKPSMKKKLDDDGNEQEGLNVPLSLGNVRETVDKKSKKCDVYDVVVNSEVVAEAKADKTGNYRHFVCQLALQYLHQKYGRQLDQKYKLPRLKYKDFNTDGSCHPQWIRAEQAPKIEEVDEATISSTSGAKLSKKTRSKKKKKKKNCVVEEIKSMGNMSAKVFVRDSKDDKMRPLTRPSQSLINDWPLIAEIGELPFRLRVDVHIDGNDVVENIQVELSTDFLVVTADRFHSIEMLLPYPVLRSTSTCATYDTLTRTLRLELRPDPAGNRSLISFDRVKPDAGSRPWMLSRALREGAPSDEVDSKTIRTSVAPSHDAEEFAEDRFLKNDLLSQHYIREKEEARKSKQKKAAEERKRREKHPNVEYIDDVSEWAKAQQKKRDHEKRQNGEKAPVKTKKPLSLQLVDPESTRSGNGDSSDTATATTTTTRSRPVVPEVEKLSISNDKELSNSHSLIFDLFD